MAASANPSPKQSELELNRKRKEQVVTPRKNPTQRKRINRAPLIIENTTVFTRCVYCHPLCYFHSLPSSSSGGIARKTVKLPAREASYARGERLQARNHKSEMSFENAPENPLDISGKNPLKVTILWKIPLTSEMMLEHATGNPSENATEKPTMMFDLWCAIVYMQRYIQTCTYTYMYNMCMYIYIYICIRIDRERYTHL